MATKTDATLKGSVSREPAWKPYRLTVEQFLAMIDAGIFPHDAHVELLGGILIQQMTEGDPHDFSLGSVAQALRVMTPAGWILREDKSLQLAPRSRPEPDVAIVRGLADLYRKQTLHAQETALVVEVSDSTYHFDRGEKWRAYATARIPVYWIVNLDKSQVEIYREPVGRGEKAAYRLTEIFGIESEIQVVIDGHDVGRIAVKEILP